MSNGLNLLDIVIVNYNSTDYLLRCLGSIFDAVQEVPREVYVEDNASGDDVDRVSAMFPQILLSKNSYNMGFSKAENKGLKQGAAPMAPSSAPPGPFLPLTALFGRNSFSIINRGLHRGRLGFG